MYKLPLIIFIISLLSNCAIYPSSVTYSPKIEGRVINEKGIPIINAKVSRRDNVYGYDADFNDRSYQDTVYTNIAGQFSFKEKTRLQWFHFIMALPFCWCHAQIKVEVDGFETFTSDDIEMNSEDRNYVYFNKKYTGCADANFKPEIVLKHDN